MKSQQYAVHLPGISISILSQLFWFPSIASFLYLWGTKYTVQGLDGLLWPTRFIGFGIGMIIYALGVSYFFNEGINAKTAVSLLLSIMLIFIQVVWKS